MSTFRVRKTSRQRLTAAQIAGKPAPEPGVGARLYEATNELAFGAPFLGFSGRFGDEVYHLRAGKCFVRRYVAPPPPDTARQLDHQDRMRIVMPSWIGLPEEVRQAWLEYSIGHFGENQLGKKRGNLGQNLFTQAQLNRLAWGAEISSLPPATAPPPRVIQVVEVPAPEGQIAWRVEHGLKLTAGCRLEVRMTPGTAGKPLDRRLVRAGATTAGSFFSLKETGTVYLLEQPLHGVSPGERYGLQVKLITPDGVEGRGLILDLVRKGAGELPADVELRGEMEAEMQQMARGAASFVAQAASLCALSPPAPMAQPLKPPAPLTPSHRLEAYATLAPPVA